MGVLVAVLGLAFMPRVPSLSTRVTGDQDLAAQSLPLLDGALDVVSIATVDDDHSPLCRVRSRRDHRLRDRFRHQDVHLRRAGRRHLTRGGHRRHQAR